jgi:hypothetical protein
MNMTTNQIISLRITTLVANGMDIKSAVDTVLGCGTYDSLASDLYDTLRASK